ncbi:C40 family peptidase [[Clostridium] colinum]|uniref:C40 family peptidase n=1 Tax=[Clostridium] colinum TaxID=36835 RepID=UPI002023C4B8|nr:C40 family peptidase [[Clostridium] colinum]
MKINITTKVSVIALALLFSNVSVYAANVITATNTNSIKQNDISVISSKNGESISKVNNLDSAFRISFTDNNYITTKFAKVTSIKNGENYVPVYSSPSNRSNSIGSIPVDSTVVIGSQEGNFSQIFFDEKIGYIENTYLVDSKPQEKPVSNNNDKPTGKYVKITSEAGLNLREEPSTSSKVLAVIPSDTYVDLIENNNGWLKVKYNGKSGYISESFGTITDKKETQTQTQTVSNKVSGEEVVNFAKAHLGKPYIYGSTNLNIGTDCSGFTYAVFKNFGININRVSRDQYLNGKPVEKKDLLIGDLVFFNTGGNSPISHVGIYIGNNQYIHSTDSKNQGVIISSLNSDYSLRTYYGARRVIPE